MKFAVGDRVEILLGLGDAQEGRIGTIIDLDEDWDDRLRLWVKFSNRSALAYRAEDVRKLSLLEVLAEAAQ